MIYNSWEWKNKLFIQAKKLQRYKSIHFHKFAFNRLAHKVDIAILLSAVIIRKLIESDKLSDLADQYILKTNTISPRRQVNRLHRWVEDGDYEWGDRTEVFVPAKNICNSIIHSYCYCLCFSNNNKLVGFLVSSDFDKNKMLYDIDIDIWIKYLNFIISDDVIAVDLHYDKKKGDYITSKKERGI